MTDVLLARGGFGDDTTLLRLHQAADLSVRTVAGSLVDICSDHVAPTHRSAPACVLFAAGRAGDEGSGARWCRVRRERDLDDIDVVLPAPAQLRDVGRSFDAGFDEKPAGGKFRVVPRGSHEHGECRVTEVEFEGRLDDEVVGASGHATGVDAVDAATGCHLRHPGSVQSRTWLTREPM